MRIGDTDALIVADVQKDFCPGGALAVKGGDEIVPVVNALFGVFRNVVLSRDWHPADHISFADNPQFVDKSWPAHCVADTPGAAFHDDLRVPADALIINKATDPEQEAYSAFSVPGLRKTLAAWGVTRVFVCGLATDYCVKNTALDALREGLETYVIEDAMRGVDVPAGTAAAAIDEMKTAGVMVCQSGDLK